VVEVMISRRSIMSGGCSTSPSTESDNDSWVLDGKVNGDSLTHSNEDHWRLAGDWLETREEET